ncbi:MAG: hypothetical protein QOH52_162 [Pseudonocardiales bacterium]|nr:Uncharacterized protein [Jatrophihabitans sp.]MDT4902146.1 hypothetical protein [Pseudonocardiales bacterium]
MAKSNPNRAVRGNAVSTTGIPGSGSREHPLDAIPLPAHGFETLDLPVRELASVPAAEVISRVAVILMNATAEKLGLVPGEEPDIDLDEARRLIEALAGLLSTSQEYLGPHREPMLEGLRTLQKAFREASVYPDEPGKGPGEQLLS